MCGAYPTVLVDVRGNFREGATDLAWKVVVKDYGVAMTMPQG